MGGSPEWDESALVAGLRAGDEGAFDVLVRTHAARLLVVARRILHDEQEAQDAVQEAFASAFRALESFAGDAKLSTWLHRITVNASLMRLRGRLRRKEKEGELDELMPRFTERGVHAGTIGAWAEASDVPAEREEIRGLVRAAIDRLPENSRIALLLRDIEGLSNEEVAERLGLTPNAAKIRVHRARQALRTLLEPRFSVVHR